MSTNLDRRPLGDDDLRSALRDAFRQGADALPRTTDPLRRTTIAVRRSQVRRRGAALAVAATVAAVGVAGSLGALPALRSQGPQPARHTQERDVKVLTDDLTTWPLRGDLVGDAAFVAAANRSLAEQGANPHLLFAGHVGGRRVGVGTVDLTQDGTVIPGAVGAVVEPTAAGDAVWEPIGFPSPVLDGQVTMGLQNEDGTVGLLVLARTDATGVAYSRAARYDDRGRPARTYVGLPVTDGVATVLLPPGPLTTTSVVVAPAGGAGTPHALQLWRTSVSHPTVPDAVYADVVRDARCTGGTTTSDVRNATTDVWQNRDPLEPPASLRAVWCRDVPGGRVGLFEVTLSHGETFQAALVEALTTTGGGGWQMGVGRAVPPGAGVTTPAVLSDIPVDGQQANRRFFVHAPGAARVELVVRGAGSLTVLAHAVPDRDGFTELLLTAAQAAQVTPDVDGFVVLRDAAGRQVAELALRDTQPNQDLDWSVPGRTG